MHKSFVILLSILFSFIIFVDIGTIASIAYRDNQRINQEITVNKDSFEDQYPRLGPFITIEDFIHVDSIYKAEMDRINKLKNKPFKMITKCKFIPEVEFVDYGTFKEIDSLKCIRQKEMENLIKQEKEQEKELDLLNNKPCNN
jgi:hypothetical protein